ncbi:integrase core domain-containing protein [Aeromonas veronii]|uniref:integrase core domain-containing protein n=1 Tax=Aeromonas veronii TaxID=654 RepID=UPI003B51B31E
MGQGVKRTQRDYSLTFKLALVEQIEKGEGYDCYQNALAERVNGILKGELLLQSPQDLTQAREMVREAVDIYNAERPHHALKYRTPDAVHRGF